jgi:hypothetical protein
VESPGAFYIDIRKEAVGIICPFFSDGAFLPAVCGVCVCAFFFYVFLRRCPNDHLLSLEFNALAALGGCSGKFKTLLLSMGPWHCLLIFRIATIEFLFFD